MSAAVAYAAVEARKAAYNSSCYSAATHAAYAAAHTASCAGASDSITAERQEIYAGYVAARTYRAVRGDIEVKRWQMALIMEQL